MERPRSSGWTLIERPYERIVTTSPHDTPESLKVLLDYLARIGSPVPMGSVLPGVTLTVPTPGTGGAMVVPGANAVAVLEHPPVGNSAGRSAGPWLSDIIEEWRQDRVDKGIWTVPQTWTNTYGPAMRVFRELIATEQRAPANDACAIWDIRIGDIDVTVLKRYLTAIPRYPSTQGQRRSTLDAKAILAASDAAREKADAKAAAKPDAKAMADAKEKAQRMYNAKKKIGIVGSFLRWAVRSEYLTAELLPKIELALEGPKADPAGGYLAFSDQMLATIFTSTSYSKDAFDSAWKYWTPLLALNAGGRVRDIADLTVDDIVDEEGIPCVWFRGGVVEERSLGVIEKRVKTVSSQRKVPIADVLLQRGFLRFVDARRQTGHTWLWEGLLWEEKSGHGRRITEWFSEFLSELGIKKGRRLVFHSFRSTLNQRLEKVGLDGAVISRLLGHAAKTTKDDKYNRTSEDERGMPLALVREKLDQISWNIDLPRTGRWGGGV